MDKENLKSKKILIVSGGGGHFSPALAVLKELPKETSILVVGRKYALEGDRALSLEYRTTQAMEIPFRPITSARLQRKFTRHTLPSFLKFPVGFAQALSIIRQFHPDLVLSFGGYISLPVVFAAASKKIPIVIHEQTLGAGLANKIAARFAKKICISWNTSLAYFPKEKTILTGNPFAKSGSKEFSIKIKNISKLPVILVTGGSAGSHSINILIEQIIELLLKKYVVIHQTGDAQEFKDFDRLTQIRDALPKNVKERYVLTKFIALEEFGSALSLADLVVCRSGMNTVTQLMYFKKPALLIPLPYSQNNEQMQNAQFLEKTAMGSWVNQNEITPQKLSDKIDEMISHLDAYKKEASNVKEAVEDLIPQNAASNIIKVVSHAC